MSEYGRETKTAASRISCLSIESGCLALVCFSNRLTNLGRLVNSLMNYSRVLALCTRVEPTEAPFNLRKVPKHETFKVAIFDMTSLVSMKSQARAISNSRLVGSAPRIACVSNGESSI